MMVFQKELNKSADDKKSMQNYPVGKELPYNAAYCSVLHSPSSFFPINMQDCRYMYQYIFTSKMVNSVHPDQLASEKPADLDAHCFHLHDVSMLSMIRINKCLSFDL